MANQNRSKGKSVSGFSTRFTWQNILMAAGVAILAPYVIRRIMPLLQGNLEDISARDVTLAGKDSVRDAADDLNVGGLSGTISRGVDRVTDHLSH